MNDTSSRQSDPSASPNLLPGIEPARLTLDWAEREWQDPLSGTRVVCLTPRRTSHCALNYFRINMFTADGQYAVFVEHEDIRAGKLCGWARLWSRNLLTGELRCYGDLPAGEATTHFAVAPRSHHAQVVDQTDPRRAAIIQFDLDTGESRRIVPSRDLPDIFDGSLSADERHVYTYHFREKGALRATMPYHEWVAMMCSQPGVQEMVRVDTRSGKVETVFETDRWFLTHPNPHPRNPDLFMCAQEYWGASLSARWGAPLEKERIRLFNTRTGQWLNTHRPTPLQGGHEHWAPSGRIYAHGGILDNVTLNRLDLDAGSYETFICPLGVGNTAHVTVAPDETFLVGDGDNFDQHNLTPELRRRLEEAIKDDPWRRAWSEWGLRNPNGGETIWKYELPENNLWDYGRFAHNQALFNAEIEAQPERGVRTTPLCRFRTLCRGPLLGYRLESNAHVTPDSRWAVFQSSSDDNRFEVWAARVPGTE